MKFLSILSALCTVLNLAEIKGFPALIEKRTSKTFDYKASLDYKSNKKSHDYTLNVRHANAPQEIINVFSEKNQSVLVPRSLKNETLTQKNDASLNPNKNSTATQAKNVTGNKNYNSTAIKSASKTTNPNKNTTTTKVNTATIDQKSNNSTVSKDTKNDSSESKTTDSTVDIDENENKLDFRVLRGSNNLKINEKMVSTAVINAGYSKPTQNQINSFLKEYVKGGISSKREAAMFLSQILWESDGLRAKEEYACQNTDCSSNYPSNLGYKGKVYHGRGYIQLTWADNYSAASKELFKDDRLLKEPALVSKTEKIAWGVSYWYWKNRVRTNPDVLKGYFGASTKMINGALECSGGDPTKPKKRFEIYKKVLAVFEPKEKPIEKGCYN
ncbi:hypothetical protein BB561_001177 [Smittium simulii]|uniref:Glycoside hydrolase family 19 catalytic domain-containing protein n=1 Tax=Smittium simulii TaxID=133385 RepID=A0A2T9YVU0_9FUNG|nr:hypothetical protein BB561_001177 [Smittium simulii]